MPTTSNFGWTTPADTDLVKDGALAIRTLGNGIDTSFLDLKGGTTGQILSKASNTDLDYTWINNDQGDITEVQAGTGISVASGTGPIPVVTNTVATAFDAKGDLVAGTGADTFAKLTVGANNTVLTADSSTATGLKWATPAGGGKVLQVVSAAITTSTAITTQSMSDTNITATITPTLASSKVLVIISAQSVISRASNEAIAGAQLLRGATQIADYGSTNRTDYQAIAAGGATSVESRNVQSVVFLDSPATTSATTYKLQAGVNANSNSGTITFQRNSSASTITLLEIGA